MNMNLLLNLASPMGHVIDKPIYDQWYVSNATVMLVLSAIVTMLLIIPAARKIATGKSGTLEDLRAKGTLANLVEVICLYLRDEIFKPLLKEDTDKYIGILWTFFWFILINNLLGLVPIADILAMLKINPMGDHYVGIGGTATQSIWVTSALAIISFIFMNGTAMKKDFVGFFKHLTAGAPVFMWPIMVPVEIIGTFVKPFALSLRLFANMTGGHIIVATLLGFVVSLSIGFGGAVGHGLAIFPLLGTMAIYLLEVLVSFIQAFIFTYLTGLFLSQLIVHDHDHDHDHGHDEAGHAPSH
ncbi:MAG TPA: ATP synthase F0 subunit A [Phycisphaerales bacterium]|nr:ATP synthase F0 subunit A [Phycisphaerales bacterium]HCD31526.1 ATP synthase F0 subunit A [Phycisphaerales bacterium]|tara:strand:- start:340 stop:1236 length:897 start_codon:yes stop_codon:yes gene_type:complete